MAALPQVDEVLKAAIVSSSRASVAVRFEPPLREGLSRGTHPSALPRPCLKGCPHSLIAS
jgi:hypothetical protein